MKVLNYYYYYVLDEVDEAGRQGMPTPKQR